MAIAQDRDRDDDLDLDRGRITLIDAGTPVSVRTRESIDVETRDGRVYRGIVAQDVRDQNGHIAIPRGSSVDMKVRVAPDNNLILDIESISVNGGRYGVWADADRVEALSDDSSVGTIISADAGVQARGSSVRVPLDSVLTFRIDHNMIVGVQVPDPGVALYARLYHHDLR
jgi:hypothetical protein